MRRATLRDVEAHINEVKACSRCPKMIGPVITPQPVLARVYLCGQAPGPHEGRFGRPFAYTAGKTMFKWFEAYGVDEAAFRAGVYIGAVCRCFPGKTKQGGDRVPSPDEITNCSAWMQREIELLRPELILAVGRLAIERFLPKAPLAEIIGLQHRVSIFGHTCDLIPLPHPSGASTWFKVEPGKTLLQQALSLVARHAAFAALRVRAEGLGTNKQAR
jgi:uracil-DNA glycosylase